MVEEDEAYTSSSDSEHAPPTSLSQMVKGEMLQTKKNVQLRTKKQRPTSLLVVVKVTGVSIAADCVPVDEDLKVWITNRDRPMTAVSTG